MFEKNLQDLVKGIRSTKGDLNVYISQCMQEIKGELKGNDPFLKAEAVRKLTYLHMLGYDMTWAAFHVVEVMSYERFAHKRIGYTAAAQSFTQSTDVVLLCTNLLKKEFGSYNEYEVGLAINVLANIVTTDLARDLLGDVVAMMNSPKPYVRKKATLALYKMFLRYPQGLRLTFDKLKERMDEPDVSVVSCAVNVICELANKKPKNYLGLAPQFFRLLTTSSNNWMLIKVVKLLASLVPEEPRLARKLLDPLATVIQNTPAKSLLYECISTVTAALLYTKKSDGTQPRNVPAVVRLCNDHLRRFIEDPDQNLRYLGLVGLSNLMDSHPYVITEHQELIVECLAVDDITIRMRALDLLARMVTPDNAAKIIRELMRQTLSADGLYRQELISRILDVCSVRKYENIHDFEWYIQVLVQLARVPSSTSCSMNQDTVTAARITLTSSDEDGQLRSHGIEVARQLVDIAVRVKSVRSVLVENMIDMLLEKDALAGPGGTTLAEVYFASAWIAGEYVDEYLDDTDDEDDNDDDDEDHETIEDKLDRLEELADALLQAQTTSLPAHVQTVYLQTLLKLVSAMSDRADDESCDKMALMILERLPALVQSEHIEVQERAMALQQILQLLGLGLGALPPDQRASRAFDQQVSVSSTLRDELLHCFFDEHLAPVGARAQRKVPIPMDLDLDSPWDEDESSFLESGGDLSVFASEDDLDVTFVQHGSRNDFDYTPNRRGSFDGSSSESSASGGEEDIGAKHQTAADKERARTDPFYLSMDQKDSGKATRDSGFAEIMDALDSSARKGKSKSKSKKHTSKKSRRPKLVMEDDLMPEGAGSSEEDRRRSRKKATHDDDALADIDLTTPLRADEKIPDEHLYHRQVPAFDEETETTHRKKHHHKKSKDAREDKHTSSKKKKTKSSLLLDEEEEEDKDDERRERRSKKSSHKSHKHHEVSEDVDADDDNTSERHHRAHRSSKKSSKSHKHGDTAASTSKEKQSSKSKKSHSSKSAASKPQDAEPLLLF